MREESPDKDFSTFTPAEEIAEALAYLCSDAAAPMNGQRLTLRGARSARVAPVGRERAPGGAARAGAGSDGEASDEPEVDGSGSACDEADPEHGELGREPSVREERDASARSWYASVTPPSPSAIGVARQGRSSLRAEAARSERSCGANTTR